jgi:hypothetical protein
MAALGKDIDCGEDQRPQLYAVARSMFLSLPLADQIQLLPGKKDALQDLHRHRSRALLLTPFVRRSPCMRLRRLRRKTAKNVFTASNSVRASPMPGSTCSAQSLPTSSDVAVDVAAQSVAVPSIPENSSPQLPLQPQCYDDDSGTSASSGIACESATLAQSEIYCQSANLVYLCCLERP